jgi:hypothetical protein
MWLVIIIILDGFLHGNIWSKGFGGWRVSEANESQTSYSVEQADIFQYQSYSHSDDIFIILKSTINTDTSIFAFSREKLHDSKYSKQTVKDINFDRKRHMWKGTREHIICYTRYCYVCREIINFLSAYTGFW